MMTAQDTIFINSVLQEKMTDNQQMNRTHGYRAAFAQSTNQTHAPVICGPLGGLARKDVEMATYNFESTKEYQEFAKNFFAANGREPNDLDKMVFSNQSADQQSAHWTAIALSVLVFLIFGGGIIIGWLFL